MPWSKPPKDAFHFAEDRNAAAMKQAARGKPYQALDILNEVIISVPSYPKSFWNRATVFDRLGMVEQAESDRQRARDLGYDPSEDVSPPSDHRINRRRQLSQASKRALGNGSDRKLAMPLSLPSLPPMPPIKASWIVAGAMVVMTVVIIIIVYAFLLGKSGESANVIAPTTQALPTTPVSTIVPTTNPSTQPPTPTPSPTLSPVTGSPFTAAAAQEVWEESGLIVTILSTSGDLDGFSVATTDLELSRDDDSLGLVMLVYGSLEAVSEDWALASGQRPSAKDGRDLPEHASVWWNRNLILVVRPGGSNLSSESFNAFISLDP